jgi:uncharacterized protein (TIGR03435 family)
MHMRASQIVVFLLASCAAAQPLARRSFDGASIKKNATCRFGNRPRPTPGRLEFPGASVRELLVTAYGSLQGDPLHRGTIQVVGGRSWIDNERYDVSAKVEGGAPLQERMGPMLIGLLEDRFQLKAHTEPRDMSVYALRLVEGPAKLHSAAEGSCKPIDMENLPGYGDPTHYCGLERSHIENGTILSQSYGITMSELASRALTVYAGNYVVDQTGLNGRFDIHLEFRRSVPQSVNGVEISSGESESGAPTIFTALREVSLKLVPVKAPIDVVVVDQVQRPSEN